jgi:hypothetical protein
LLARQHVGLQVLALKQGRILGNLVRSQGRNSNAARDLGLDGRLRRGSGRPDAFEAGDWALLESYLWRGLSSSLGMANEAKDNAEPSGSEEAAVLLVGDLPYL